MYYWVIFSNVQVSKNIPKTYPNISKYSISKTRAGRGGPAAAWYFVYVGISWIYLDIFGYIYIYFLYIFGQLDPRENHPDLDRKAGCNLKPRLYPQ